MTVGRIRKGALAVGTGAAVLLGFMAPAANAADRWTHITPAQCRVAHAAVATTGHLPNPTLLRLDGEVTSLQGDTLHIYTKTPIDKEVHEAADAWVKASHGKIKFVFHDAPGKGIVSILHNGTQGIDVGDSVNIGKDNPAIYLHPNIKYSDHTNRVFIVAHEIGHHLGLAHGCAGDIMKAGVTSGAPSTIPTDTDVAAVIQGRAAFQ